MEFNPHTRLAGECLQPLGHLSLGSMGQCKAWPIVVREELNGGGGIRTRETRFARLLVFKTNATPHD